MHRFTAALLLTLLCSAPAFAECSRDHEESLLTTTIFNEAVSTREAHASVMATVLNRLKKGTHGSTICAVLTEKGPQFDHKMHKKMEPEKWALAKESAKLFLDEYHSQGYISTEAAVFERLKGMDSFHAANAQMRGPKGKRVRLTRGPTIGDNTFYRAGH